MRPAFRAAFSPIFTEGNGTEADGAASRVVSSPQFSSGMDFLQPAAQEQQSSA